MTHVQPTPQLAATSLLLLFLPLLLAPAEVTSSTLAVTGGSAVCGVPADNDNVYCVVASASSPDSALHGTTPCPHSLSLYLCHARHITRLPSARHPPRGRTGARCRHLFPHLRASLLRISKQSLARDTGPQVCWAT
ncbi:hypothetical protein ZWY2020_011850 [Hordeum vulgare]|nr:hypothetical protein ZWY2020_011850 [Hordeum vulgare]